MALHTIFQRIIKSLIVVVMLTSFYNIAQAQSCPTGYQACGEQNQLCCPI